MTVSAYLIPDLERDEDVRLKAYKDSRGIWTIGVGHNLQVDPALLPQLQHLITVGITQEQCDALLQADVNHVITRLNELIPWWTGLSPLRADVLANMGFNLGVEGLLAFHNTLSFIERGDYVSAAGGLLNSKWATQVGKRADRLALQMKTGEHAA
jgi:lysozyme